MTEAHRARAGTRGLAISRLRPLLAASTALTALAAAQPARAQAPLATPTGGAVVAGGASIAEAPGATTVTQSTSRAAINWQSFNVGSRATVLFQQPSSQAVTLNRVVAPDPSTIAGRITANGSIVLVNPDGVVFANGSEVNAAGLVVSAPGITNQNFMAGRMVFDQPANPNARIVNRGSMTIAQAGLAALVAPQVANSGVIAAKLGSVVLAGARTATLDLYGDGLVSIDVEGAVQTVPVGPNGQPVKALVTNSGTIAAAGGTVLLTAKAVDGLIQNLVDAGGTISANGQAGGAAGTVLVQGVGGSIRIAGTLTASGEGTGGTGGAVGLDASGAVVLANTARVDASGPAGGGLVAVGTTLARAKGGPGTTATLTAAHVLIAPGATISADATEAGNGGRVTVLSTVTTVDYGAITAEGGSLGGNGGFVEISGHNLALDGTVNTSAPLGAMGTILLDPYDLVIESGGTGAVTMAPVPGVAYDADGTLAGDVYTVDPTVIETNLTGNVTLQAIDDVTFASSLALTKPNQSLLVQAGNDILIDSGVTVSATGNIEMDASSAAISGSTMTGGITMNGVIVAGGNISLSAGTGGVFFGDFVDANDGNVTTNQTTGTLVVNTTGNFEQVAGTISAVTLSGTASFVDVESAGNAIGTLGAFTLVAAGSAIFLSDTSNLTVTGPVSAPGGFVGISSNGNLTVAGPIDAPSMGDLFSVVELSSDGNMVFSDEVNAAGGTVMLTSGGSITEPGGVILAGTLSGSSGGAALFTGDNAIATLAVIVSDDPPAPPAFSAGGNFTLVDSAPLTITAPVTVPEGSTITLATDSLVEGSQFDEETEGTEFGALEAPGGEVLIEPFSANVPVALVGGGAQPAGALSLDDALLAAITANTLALTSFGTEPVTISGANQLGGLTDPNTGNPSGVNTLLVAAGGAFSEAAGASLNVDVLSGSAASVALGGINTIPTLDQFSSTGGFELTDTSGLTVLGTVSDPTGITLDVASEDGITLGNFVTGEGSLSSNPATGTVSLLTSGDIFQDSGAITAGTLTGSASFAFLDGDNAIATLGAFSVPAGDEIFLNDVTNLTLAGPVSAIDGFVSLASAGDLVLSGELNATGGTVVLSVGGGITEPGGAILASVLNGTSGGAALFTGTNAIGTLADVSNSLQSGPYDAFVAGGDFTLVDSTSLTLEAPVSVPAGDTIALVTNGLIEGSQTIFTETSSLTVFGALLALGGEVSIEPFSANVPVALVGAGAEPAGTLSLDDALLAVITAGTLQLTSFGSEPITISGANQLGNLTDPNTGQASGVGTLLATAGGVFSETAGASLEVGVLTGSAGSVALGGINTIPTLDQFSSTGGFELSDSTALTVLGTLSAPGGIALDVAPGNLVVGASGQAGFLTTAAGMNLVVPDGSITVANGSLAAGTLSGAAAGLAQLGTADIATLGSFSVSGAAGDLALRSTGALTISGPVSAAFLDIAAPGTLTLSGTIFTTGLPLADQSGANPALPGSVLEVLSGGVFQELGTSVIAPLGGGGATLRIQLPAAGGTASFANLQAGAVNLVLALGPGTATGTMAPGGLLVIGTGGSADLFGSVGGITGTAAARVARIEPSISTSYLFNRCVIESAICSTTLVLAQVPPGIPNLVATNGGPSLLPFFTLPPIVLLTIPAVIGESWTDIGGFPLPNIARLDF